MPQRDVVNDRGWKRRFDDPIPLPRGRQLVTLKDVADCIEKIMNATNSMGSLLAAPLSSLENGKLGNFQRELAKTTGKSLRMLNCKQTQ